MGRGLAENLLAQLVWQVVFSTAVAGVETVTFWQVVDNAPPVAVGLVFMIALALCLLVLRSAKVSVGRAGELGGGQKQEAKAEGANSPITQQEAKVESGATVTQVGSVTYYAPPVALVVPSADVRINAVDNGASEYGLRWFHVRAFTLTDVLAKSAWVRVKISGGSPERWRWAERHEYVTLGQQGHEIPVIAGTTPRHVVPLRVGWNLRPRIWHRTPLADATPGAQITPFGPNQVFELEVIVSWPEGDHEGWSRATFELRQDDTGNDAWLVKIKESNSVGLTPSAS